MYKTSLVIALVLATCCFTTTLAAANQTNYTDISKMSLDERKSLILQKGCEFAVVNTKFEVVNTYVPATDKTVLVKADAFGIEAFTITDPLCDCKVRSLTKEVKVGLPESMKVKVRQEKLTYKVPYTAKSLSVVCGIE